MYDGLVDDDWVLGKTPEFTNNLEERFTWGLIDFYLLVKKGRIVEGTVFSDCLIPEYIDALNKQLSTGELAYSK